MVIVEVMEREVLDGPILLFDGECGFCDATVQWIMDHDSQRVFRMAALQGETAQSVLARHPEVPENLDSLIIVEQLDGQEVLSWESRAVAVGAGYLGYPWRILSIGKWIPRGLTDPMYRLIARHRLKIMGRLESCRVPTEAEQQRFLP